MPRHPCRQTWLQLSIWLPLTHTGLAVELELLIGGTAIDPSGRCALLAEGSVYCPVRQFGRLVPLELRPGDVAMSVWPRQLEPGQRAAIRFADLRETTAAFTARARWRIEVFGDGSVDIGSDYRLLDGDGVPLVAEDDGSYLIEGGADLAATSGKSPHGLVGIPGR